MIQVPTQSDSLNTWLEYLLARHSSELASMDLGLERVGQVAASMGLLDLAPTKVITVGGTNGKGTSCAMLESILRDAGMSVGVYSSPHLVHFNERVRINGIDAPDADIIGAFAAIEQARGDISLSYFEFATLTGLYLFKQAKLDVAILEVGLGGRLDATNIIDADVAVVTAVDLDHQEFLGNTRESVGFEKAGIFKSGKQAITGEPDLPVTVMQVAEKVGAPLHRVGKEFNYKTVVSEGEQLERWQFEGQSWQLDNLPMPNLPLPNAATVLATLEMLLPELPQSSIERGLINARLTGRFEKISDKPLTILDVAHNPHAARYLASRLEQYQGIRVLALCGMLKDKDIAGVLEVMSPVVDEWFLTELDTERSAELSTLTQCLPKEAQYQAFTQADAAWQALTSGVSEDDVVIVFGSFYTVSAVKSFIDGE
ncbi:bifunctional tetrahydrofolate synthase/dihydrofolate synthase [Shewanella corallii]|uniref:Dihydrofolate synthase/folylpolyglutamate synthase n=1 Tax=Shewanella corallii TaxID=560080 RepID=A0ABT0NB95_9GAMM|nr:bifunctional tetrahydrofolate synthase/dihydrofolate synthase [Shewanella corallii]MCL2915380.1 bifunctional tetrahydrofolate synthase/dihydrofolate synthase [Shewanella corallii]